MYAYVPLAKDQIKTALCKQTTTIKLLLLIVLALSPPAVAYAAMHVAHSLQKGKHSTAAATSFKVDPVCVCVKQYEAIIKYDLCYKLSKQKEPGSKIKSGLPMVKHSKWRNPMPI